jgi:hypothetical protein
MTERIRGRVGALCVGASIGLLAASAPAVAAKKPITGKLSKPSYTVFALAKNGTARSAQAKGRKFRVKPPGKFVTLHLRAKDGSYAGPVVVGTKKRGKRAVLGIKAGAKLGKVKVKVRKGYARVKRKLPKKFIDAKRKARAKKGVPIGAGNFGRVRSKHTKGGAPGDRDLDGVPDPLDIDDDGDRILDNLDRSSVGGGARAAQGCGPNNVYCHPISSNMAPGLKDTVNVNALAGLTPEQIQQQVDTILASQGYLMFGPLSDSAELDCGGEPDPANPDGWIGGLSWCTRGGTGQASFGPAGGPPFPGPAGGQFDADGDGFGTFPQPAFIAHRATSAQIKTGQWLNQVVTIGGVETKVPITLNFVFVTVPALVSYSDTAGNSATVSYPVGPGDPGNFGNGFPVAGGPCPANPPAACVDGDVVVTLAFWPPQRQPIAGSDPPAAQWMDIGHLTYTAYAPAAGHPAVAGGCPQTTFSSADPNLTLPSIPILGTGGLEDLKDDQVSSPGNTLNYELDVSQCLAANGLSFNPGEEQMINFMAVSGATDAAEQQGITFNRRP